MWPTVKCWMGGNLKYMNYTYFIDKFVIDFGGKWNWAFLSTLYEALRNL